MNATNERMGREDAVQVLLELRAGDCAHAERLFQGALDLAIEALRSQPAQAMSDACAVTGCIHLAHDCPTWPAGSDPFSQPAQVAADALVIAQDFNEVLAEEGLYCECGQADCRTTRLRAFLAAAPKPAEQGEDGLNPATTANLAAAIELSQPDPPAESGAELSSEDVEALLRATDPPAEHKALQGFVGAFQEIVGMLGIPSPQAISPREVYETQVRPRIAALVAAQAATPPPQREGSEYDEGVERRVRSYAKRVRDDLLRLQPKCLRGSEIERAMLDAGNVIDDLLNTPQFPAPPQREAGEAVAWRLVGNEQRPKPRRPGEPEWTPVTHRLAIPAETEYETVSLWEATIRAATTDGKPPATTGASAGAVTEAAREVALPMPAAVIGALAKLTEAERDALDGWIGSFIRAALNPEAAR